MADVNANIGVHIDTSAALAELKNLQRQLANFHSSVAKNSAAAAQAQKSLQTNLLNAINATGKFRAQMGLVRTSTESFTHALETNKLSMREYFRYAGGSTKTFGKLFRQEFNTIGKVAEERVKKMQTQYIKMGRDASGAMKAISITPNTLNMKDYSTQLAVAAQRQALLNQLLKQGSTNLLNFGKNTQWAGRQLMVGFTIPLAYFGTAAAKTFMDLEKQAIRFKRVYGDMFTTTDETNKALADVQRLAEEFTKYGVAVTETMEMAANAAAMGKTGADLTAQVAEATRLAVLGGVEQAQALETTISVTNAFGVAAEDLAKKVNFLNAVENQTVVSIEDLTIAIPKAGPVVKQLGGDVEDLAFFLTAMKEGGINASEGANALKSGLASLINPTKKASDMLAGFGINIKAIVEGNQGNIKETVIDFAQALDTLDPLNRARAIEQLFGKFQFSRLSTLFQNVTKEGTQAARVLELAGASVEELAILSERELGVLEDAVGTNFRESVEKLKVAIAPIGKTFLEAVTPIIQVVGRLLDKFDNLGEGTKKFIVVASTLVGVIGPILLMTFGLLANGVANIIKLFITMRSGFLRAGTNTNLLAQQTQYLNSEQLEAATVAASLNQAHTRLTQSFSAETTAVRLLRQAYIDATIAATNFARANPGMMMPGGKFTPKKFASGVTEVPGTGNKDTVPSMLTPGEAVIPKGIAQDPRFRPIIDAMVNGTLQGFGSGSTGVYPVNIPSQFNPEGKVFNAKQAVSAKSIQEFLASLKKNPDGTYTYIDPKGKYNKYNIPVSKIANVLNERSSAGSFNLSQIQEKLGIGSTGFKASTKKSGVTSRPQFIADAMNKMPNKGIPGLDLEVEAIKKRFAQVGLNISDRKQARLFQVDASHIKPEIGPDGRKIWKMSNIAPDTGYVNNFISNSLKGKLGKALDKMSTKELSALGIDKNAFKSMYAGGDPSKGSHPVTAKQAQTLQAIARYVTTPGVIKQLGLTKNALYQAHALDAGLGTRFKTGFYKGGIKSLKNILIAMTPGEGLIDNKGKPSQVTVSTGKPKTKDTVQIGGTKKDTRTLPALKVGRVIPKPGFRGPGSFAIGADGGLINNSVVKPGSGFRMGNIAPNMRVADTQLQQLITALNTNAQATTKLTEPTKQNAKDLKREQRAQRAQRVGSVAGPVAGLAGIGAMAGFMTGNTGVGTAMMGISALATIAPMLTNPIGIAVAAAATLAGGFLLLNKRMDDATKKQVEYVNSVTAGTKQMQKVGELTGKVGASQIAQRQRETGTRVNQFRTGYDRGGNQFGTNFLASDIGKEIFKGFNDTVAKDGNKAAKLLATQLGAYISDGVMSAEQANSVARAIGINLGDMSISTNISGKLRELIGPDGQNLLTNPLQVRLNIISSQAEMSNQLKDVISGFDTQNGEDGFDYRNYVAQAAVSNAKNLEIVQAQRDAQWQTNQAVIDTLEKQQLATTDKTKQLQLEQQIITAKSKQKAEDQILAQKSKQVIKDAEDLYNLARNNATGSSALAAGKFIDSLQAGIKAANKDNPFLNAFIEKGAALQSVQLEAQIDTAVLGGQLSIPTAMKLMEMFAGVEGGEAKLKGILETTIVSQNPGVVQAFFDIVSGKKIDSKITTEILDPVNGGSFEDRVNVLNKLKDFDGDSINLTTFINEKGTKGIDELTKDFKAIENIKGPITLETISKITELSSDPNLNMSGLALIWDKYKNATDEIKKTVIQEYIAVFKSLGPEEAKNFIQNEIAKGYGFGENSERKIAAIKSKYVNPDGTANLPAIAAELVSQRAAAAPNTIPGGGIGGGNGGERDTTLDELLKKLKMTRDASINAEGGISELNRIFKESGGDITKFTGVIQQLNDMGANLEFVNFIESLDNKTQAAYLNVKKLKKGIVELTPVGEKAMQLFSEAGLGEFNEAADTAIKTIDKQSQGFNRLRDAGVSVADSLQMMQDEQFMYDLQLAKGSIELQNGLIAKYYERMNAEQKLLEDTDPQKAFEIQMKKAMEYYDFLEKEAKAAAQPEIDRINDLISANNKLIESKQRNIEMQYDRPIEKFNQDLAIIDKATDEINKKYDKQIEALEKVFSLNEEIANQEKSRLSIASALTSGDVAAAASAVQDARAQAAASQLQKQKTAIEASRTQEIAGLTIGGKTRAQIEAEIYKLQQDRIPILTAIRDLEDQNYNYNYNQLQPLKDALDAKIKNIDASRTAFENQQLAIQKAAFEADKTTERFKLGIDPVKMIKNLWDAITDKNITVTATYTTAGKPLVTSSTYASAYGAFSELYRSKMYGGKILPMNMGGVVPKYMVDGGGIGSDTVPAMLTPGEFVMNKRATEEFGPLLSMLNESKYPSMIGPSYSSEKVSPNKTSINNNSRNVYNYNVGINVGGTNASANNIAKAVMDEIKYLDAQRIRGQRAI